VDSLSRQTREGFRSGDVTGPFPLRVLLGFHYASRNILFGTHSTQHTLNMHRLPKRSPYSSETRDRVPAAEQTKIDRIPGPLFLKNQGGFPLSLLESRHRRPALGAHFSACRLAFSTLGWSASNIAIKRLSLSAEVNESDAITPFTIWRRQHQADLPALPTSVHLP